MKKCVICFAILMFGLVGIANAMSWNEEYTGYQGVSEGQSFNFGFDMWYPNWVYGVGTDSSLSLTEDAAGAFGDWDAATLTVGLYSDDWFQYETAGITLTAWGQNNQSFDLGTYAFNAFWPFSEYTLTFDLNSSQLAAMSSEGWGNVTITATPDGKWWNCNDFGITKVGLTASVPEPATMLLLGTGLIGLIGIGTRRRIK